MKHFATTLKESKGRSAIVKVYSNESLTSMEAEQLASPGSVLIFNPNNPCYELTGRVSIQDPTNTDDQLKLENNDILYKVAEAEVVCTPEVETTYCPFQKGFVLKNKS